MAAAQGTSPSRSDRHVIAFLALTGTLLALGIDIALPAFDEIRPAIGLDPSSNRITLMITVYFVGMAVGQLVWGPISDRFGRIPTMYAGVGLYVVAALGAAFAPNLATMLVVRSIWGLGAAAPAGLRNSIARDLYSGDDMARVMSLMMAIFMVGPIAAPLLGELILYVLDWRSVFLFCAIAGCGQLLWAHRFGETLPLDARRPLRFGPTMAALAEVVRTRVTLAYTVAFGFSSASFFVFLSSAQPIMDRLYGRADQFAIIFGASGIVMAGAFVATNRLVSAFGGRRVALWSSASALVVAIVSLVIVLATDGLPSFWLWLLPVLVVNLAAAPLGPVGITLALEPMGEMAGTASGVVGFLSLMIGSVSAAFIDAQITTTVTAMAVGSVVFLIASTGSVLWANQGET